MKSISYRVHGDTDVLEVTESDVPEPGPGEVLVQVAACGLNHLDVLQRRGPALIPGFELPHVAGMDVAGTVAAVGPDVDPAAHPVARTGARVVVNPAVPCDACPVCASGADGMCPATEVVGGNVAGGYAEYVVVPAGNVHAVPDGVDLVEAAVVPTIWMTAWHALVEVGAVAAGETVLVHAGASGVSTAAIQLAKAAGARVITTVSSAAKASYAAELGADLVVDTSTTDLVGAARGFTDGRGVDVVIDHVGPAVWDASIYSLGHRGRLVFLGNTTGDRTSFDLVYAYHFGLKLLGSDPYDRREFGPMLERYWSSGFRTPVDSEFPLAEAAAAQRHMESRRATGKIVLRP
ncbi:zinc-binding dehydrogenase [Trujillonella humicola]|uniref:zinc-binding dehydrogenase n=1 Tax=Trujillonella humicola TaxID=3383699 RepID=UPI003905A62D